jgi:hypothetical protein
MKATTLALASTLAFAASAHGANNPSKQYVTVSQRAYTLVADAPTEMQPAYRGPDGTTWGDAAKDKFGAPLQLPQADAYAFCKGIKVSWFGSAHLPTVRNLLALRESMSKEPNPSSMQELKSKDFYSANPSFDPSKPALPDFDTVGWTSTLISTSMGADLEGVYELDPSKGIIFYTPVIDAVGTLETDTFRCVY